ncbi:MAG: M43 family zinc metalloprotease [Phycisphaerales bacterium]|nr:M43 family zinc metalloprotease [Phycisphaerales bacterium]
MEYVKRALLVLLTLVFLPGMPALGQVGINEWDCGTVLTPEGADFAKRKIDEGAWSQSTDTRDLPLLFIGVTCHIVRYSDGSEGIPESRVDTAIADLNLHMVPAGLSFFRDGDFIYIDNDDYAELFTSAQRDELRQYDPVEGTMNVWFIPVLAGLCGESSFTFSTHQGIMMANDCTATASDRATFSHEVGHYFNLFHTFETAIGVECVDGSNCDDAGDQVCDTAADFGRYCDNGSTAVDGQCNLTCTDQDPCGSGLPYDPPIKNLMSYTTQRCTDHFTPNQLARARSVAVEERQDHIVQGNVNEPGACCLNVQCIEVEAAGLCLPLGGTYMGAGTSCEDADLVCDLPGTPGACCFNSNCTNVSSVVECQDIEGIFAGVGTTCDTISCEASSPGACCTGLECTEVASILECALEGGLFVGLNSNCSDISCFQGSPGACCLGDACNDVGSIEDCDFLNGIFMGIGTTCGSDPCDSDLSCCVGIDCVAVDSISECIFDLGGAFLGSGNVCDTASCIALDGTSAGACCFGGSCTDVDVVYDCIDAGGTYLGLGVLCAADICTDTTGVCCILGNCVEVGQEFNGIQCLETSPDYLGPGTSCDFDPCLVQSGACCFSISCVTAPSYFACEAAGGAFLGQGTLCPAICGDLPGSPGACCFSVDPLLPPTECQDVVDVLTCLLVLGGDFAGLNTSCDDDLFDCQASPGSCCLGDECLDVLSVIECEGLGGIYLEVDCQFISCDFEISGACCFSEDSCVNITRPVSQCFVLGGEFKGEGTSCEENPSPCALTGACCIGSVCSLETPDVCQFSSGEFFGIGSECVGDPCAQDPSVCLPELTLGADAYSGGQRGTSLSTKGSLLLVGAPGEDLPNGTPDAGMAYLYEQSSEQLAPGLVVPPSTGEGQGRYQDRFGCSVSVDGVADDGITVIGASHHDYYPQGPPDINSGIVYVYSNQDIKNQNQTDPAAPLLVPNPVLDSYDYFGHSVEASLSGSEVRMVVGAPGADANGPNSGAAYFYKFDRDATDLSDATVLAIPIPGIGYSDQAAIGSSVSICSPDLPGLSWVAAIGIPGDDASEWEDAGKICIVMPGLIGNDSTEISFKTDIIDSERPEFTRNLGRSVKLYYDDVNDHLYLIAGALRRDESDDDGNGRGVFIVYEYDSTARKWGRLGFPPFSMLQIEPENNNCAESLSMIVQDGVHYALVGCPGAHWNGFEESGLSVLYTLDESSGRWIEFKTFWACDQTADDAFGTAVAMDTWIVSGAPNSLDAYEGHVYAEPFASVVAASGSASRSFQGVADISSAAGIGTRDGLVDSSDLMALLELWGECSPECSFRPCQGDLNGDCQVDTNDLLLLLSSWNR